MSTHLKPIHRSSGPLGAALAGLPVWAQARDRLEALERFPVVRPKSIETAAAARIEVALTSEDSTSADLLEDVAMLMNRAAAEQLLSATLVGMREVAVAAMDDAIVASVEHLRINLNDQLTSLLEEATEPLDQIGQVDDVETALDAGVIEPYRRMRTLRDTYVELRSAQQRLFALNESMGRNMRQLVSAYIAAPLDVDPEFIERRLNRQIREENAGGWRMRDPRPEPWPNLNEAEALDWLVANPAARPWIPTSRQLEEAEAELQRSAREFNDDHRAQLTGKRTR